MSFPVCLVGLLALATLAINIGLGGSVASRSDLAEELTMVRPITAPHYAVAPFKYRVLFRLLVDTMRWPASLVWGPVAPGEAGSMAEVSVAAPPSRALYAAWLFASAAAFLAAVLAFMGLLRKLSFAEHWAFLGCILWLLSPPVFFLYIFPVNTLDDMLALVFIVLGVRGIVASQYWTVFACSVLGVLSRESLLLLPLACFFWPPFRWRRGLSLLAAGAGTFVAMRLAMGWESYPVFEWGLAYNLQWPVEAATGLWLVFGVAWVPACLDLLCRVPRPPLKALDGLRGLASPWIAGSRPGWAFVYRSSIPISVVMVGAHTVLGRLREIRISFLLAPWIIPVGLAFLQRAGAFRVTNRMTDRYGLLLEGSLVWSGMTAGVLALRTVGHAYWRLGEFRDAPWLGLLCVHAVAAACFIAWWGWGHLRKDSS